MRTVVTAAGSAKDATPLLRTYAGAAWRASSSIYKGGGKTGGYRWLKSRNGEIVASGEAYETKAGAKKGVDAVQRAAVGAKVEDLTADS